MENKTKLTIGVFILLATIGTTYFIASEDQANLYQCGEIVGLCFKLSNININNISSRCYYNLSAPRKYKNCKTGWIKVEFTEIIGDETTLPDREVYQMKYDFTSKAEAETYIENLKNEVTYTYQIIAIEQTPYSDMIEVRFLGYIMKGEDRLDLVFGMVIIPETATKEEIESKVSEEAQSLFEEWRPGIIIGRNDLI